MPEQWVAYYRVSTDKQGRSGLGLEAQRAAVEYQRAASGAKILAEYVEVESGKRNDRPELAKAIARARRARAKLVIAKLDRLGRKAAFLLWLLDEFPYEIMACDCPNSNRMMFQIRAVFAEEEGRLISERTRAALAALKARGVPLGSARPGHWEGREDRRLAGALLGCKRSGVVKHQKALAGLADLRPVIDTLRASGASLAAIAAHLTAAGHTTPRGCSWTRGAVHAALNLTKGVSV